jgi:hypothetical protein
MAWVLPLIALMTGAVMLLIVVYMMGVLVPPIYDIVSQNNAVINLGFDSGVETAMRIGTQYVPAFLALSVILWFFLIRLRRDEFQGTRR